MKVLTSYYVFINKRKKGSKFSPQKRKKKKKKKKKKKRERERVVLVVRDPKRNQNDTEEEEEAFSRRWRPRYRSTRNRSWHL